MGRFVNAISTLDKWLGESVNARWSIVVCILAIFFITFSQTMVTDVLDVISHPLSQNPALSMSASNKENNTNSNDVTIDLESPWLVVFLAYAAFAEELMFRFLPLVIIFSIIKRVLPNVNIFSRLLLIVASSFLFGISHGGLDHLLVQGVAGVVLCIVFLKCGGAAEKVSYESSYIRANLRGLLCSIFTHFWINYIIIIMDIVFFGMRYVTLHS